MDAYGNKDNFYYFFLLFLIVGFAVVSPISYFINIDSRNVSVVYRSIVAVYSIIIICNSIFAKPRIRVHIPLFFIFFWFFYLVRIFSDLYYSDVVIKVFQSRNQYLEYAILVSFLPSLGIFFVPVKRINFSVVLHWTYRLLLFVALLSFSHIYTTKGGISHSILSLYYISYGHLGTTLAFLSLFLLKESPVVAFFNKLIYVVGFFLGLLIIYLAAARSPVISLLVMIALYLFQRNNIKKSVISILILFAVLILFLIFLNLLNFNSSFFIRSFDMVKGNSNGRFAFYMDALREFSNSPLFGNAFLLQSGEGKGYYPHNIIIEVVMATGVIGLALFLGWIRLVCNSSVRILRNTKSSSWIIYLWVQYFIFGFTSLSLFGNSNFWYYSVLIYVICRYQCFNKLYFNPLRFP